MKNESKSKKELTSKPVKNTKEKSLSTEDIKSEAANSSTGKIPDSNKRFDKDDLLRFKLAEAKYQNAQMFVQLKTHEFEKSKAAWEAYGRELLVEIEKGQLAFQQTINELSAIRAELEKKYSINLEKISYHESTGTIYEH